MEFKELQIGDAFVDDKSVNYVKVAKERAFALSGQTPMTIHLVNLTKNCVKTGRVAVARDDGTVAVY